MNSFNDVGDFHAKFGLDNVTHHGPGPRDTSPELMEFRIKFMHEELTEFEDAYAAHDDAKMFDALIDLVYVVLGTAHLRGYPWHQGWASVHLANMSKTRAAHDGSDSVRGSAWDVVKPEGWIAPDLTKMLSRYGFIGPPEKCPQCQRILADVTLKEIINKHRFVGQTMVDIHCPCGRFLLSRAV